MAETVPHARVSKGDGERTGEARAGGRGEGGRPGGEEGRDDAADDGVAAILPRQGTPRGIQRRTSVHGKIGRDYS